MRVKIVVLHYPFNWIWRAHEGTQGEGKYQEPSAKQPDNSRSSRQAGEAGIQGGAQVSCWGWERDEAKLKGFLLVDACDLPAWAPGQPTTDNGTGARPSS